MPRGPDLNFGSKKDNYAGRCTKCGYIYWHGLPGNKTCVRCKGPVVVKVREMNESGR